MTWADPEMVCGQALVEAAEAEGAAKRSTSLRRWLAG
jgi:hypothetical protein